MEVRIPAERPSKPAKTMAIPQARPCPPFRDPSCRRYIQTRAAELAAAQHSARSNRHQTTHRALGLQQRDRDPRPGETCIPEFAACSQGMRQSPIHITAQDVEAGPAPLWPLTHRSSGGTVPHSGHGRN